MLLDLDIDDVAAQSSAARVTEPEATAVDVGGWLRELGLEQYEAAFRENDVDAEVLPTLTADDLKDLGITSIGHRRRLLEAIAALRSKAGPLEVSTPSSPAPPIDPSSQPEVSETTAERRPLSVMFCDLIGSTALSARLDPEDLREVIRGYQARVAATIRQFDGFIARYVGDGVLIYFGWPQAHETDAERAVRAGLAVATAVSETPVGGESLQVRIGIATGLAVIGEPIGAGDARQQTAVGETPNRAARLQSLAGPGQVVIDAATRRQIGGLFDCRDLGTIALKGLPEPVPAWRVLSAGTAEGRFEALHGTITPLVGREEEIELLLHRWAQAKAGNGKVVLISAEPGVGKSRLAEALAAQIASEPHIRLRWFCSPHHQDSALYPVIAQMERAAGFMHGDVPAARFAKLQVLLAAAGPSAEDVALIADLHGWPTADLAPLPDLTPQRKKERTFEALLSQLEALVRQQPVLLVFDDVHWIDPSSRTTGLHHRADGEPADAAADPVPPRVPAAVGRPAAGDAADAAPARPAGHGSDGGQRRRRCSTARRDRGGDCRAHRWRAAVCRGTDQGSTGSRRAGWGSPVCCAASGVVGAGDLARVAAGALDRLGPVAREVAQAGAAIGREFGHALVVSVADLPEPQLREALDRLVNAGLVFARGTPPEVNYLFKHALVQDAAYGSLLRSRRQSLHRRIAATLGERFPEIAQAQPALLAQHCQAAGLAEQAVVHWVKAAQQALARPAWAEAAAQARKGLEALAGLPDDPWRQQQELDLASVLAWALGATRGWSAAEPAEALARAEALAEKLDRPEHLVSLMLDRWGVHVTRGEYKLAVSVGKQIEDIGKVRNDVAIQAYGRLAQGMACRWLGELVAARALLEHAIPALPPGDRWSAEWHALGFAYASNTLALLGYIDQGRSRIGEALSLRHRIRNGLTLARVLGFANMLDHLTGSRLIYVEEMLALATEQKFPEWFGWALVYRGLALATLGQAQEALALLTQGIGQLRAIGMVASLPWLLARLANVTAMLGRSADAWTYLAEAARIVEATDARMYEAEVLHRIPGDLLAAAGDQSGAEGHYRQAIAVAERQSAKLDQLRAATSLARLWRDPGKRAEARDLLASIYGWFTEGFDAPVLKEAKALLDELA